MFEIWDILRPLAKFCLYPAMFLAAGGLIFELVFAAPPGPVWRLSRCR